MGWYTQKFGGEKYNFSNHVTDNQELYAHWELAPIEDTTDNNDNSIPDAFEQIIGYGTDRYDSDSDGLPDFLEEFAETDNANPDTDGDGLIDGYEILKLMTDPLKKDTDENGVTDDAEDIDGDGLSNLQEYELGTNPIEKDSDNDGLNDGDELTYHMNPQNPITLNDEILDKNREIPVVLSGESSDNGEVQPQIAVTLKGTQVESLSIDKIDETDVFLNNNLPGIIGSAYDLNVDGAISNATLTFNLSDGYFSNGANPVIFSWNDTTQTWEELQNQVREGNIVRANLSHFSAYTVLDKNAHNQSLLEYEIKAPADDELQNKTFDLVLVLDESGSIIYSVFVFCTPSPLSSALGLWSEHAGCKVLSPNI